MRMEKVGSRGYRIIPETGDSRWDFPTEIYLIDLGKKAILCDTHTGPEIIKKALSIIFKEIGNRELIIFNTHAHWDHVAGNCAFSDETIIISTDKSYEIMKECLDFQFANNSSFLEDNIRIRLPNLVFSQKLSYPEYKIEFVHAPGHTPGCGYCLDLLDNTVFIGDIAEAPIPSFDYYRLDLYSKTLKDLLDAEYKHIITSHSGIADRELIKGNLDYVNSFLKGTDINAVIEDYEENHIFNTKTLKISYYEEKMRELLQDSFSIEKFYSSIDLSKSAEEIEEDLQDMLPDSLNKKNLSPALFNIVPIKDKKETYLDLCSRVYELSKPEPPPEIYAFYREYANNAEGRIIEPMCGTGRYLLPLLLEGFNICGFDLSPYMLSLLESKAKAKGIEPDIWQGSMDSFDESGPYDLVFIPDGSFCLLTDTESIMNALKTIYDNLAEGGIFVFDVETIHSVPHLGKPKNILYRLDNGGMIIYTEFAHLKDNLCSYICRYELVEDNEIKKTEIEEIRIILHEKNELSHMLMKAGFKEINDIKAFKKSQKPGEKDHTIVYECKR